MDFACAQHGQAEEDEIRTDLSQCVVSLSTTAVTTRARINPCTIQNSDSRNVLRSQNQAFDASEYLGRPILLCPWKHIGRCRRLFVASRPMLAILAATCYDVLRTCREKGKGDEERGWKGIGKEE